jgi:hypothetical protein
MNIMINKTLIKITLPNTDNMGKLFVTLFALLLHSRQICYGLYRDRANARHQLCNRG